MQAEVTRRAADRVGCPLLADTGRSTGSVRRSDGNVRFRPEADIEDGGA